VVIGSVRVQTPKLTKPTGCMPWPQLMCFLILFYRVRVRVISGGYFNLGTKFFFLQSLGAELSKTLNLHNIIYSLTKPGMMIPSNVDLHLEEEVA